MSKEPSTSNSDSPPDRKMIGGFEILYKIGQGGMGTVFKARQVSVDRIVALKVLPQKLAKNKRFVTRFLREAQSAAQLSHPNVVHAIDVGNADGYYYFAMEYIEGRNLGDLRKSKGKLSERRALEIARDVARALDCAHQAGLIHRDVKPDNVLITPDGTAKLADLGLARQTDPGDASVTIAGTAIGTPYYISPEQVRGDLDLDGRTDIYSLGAMLYHLLVGKPPYAGNTAPETMAQHITEPVPDLRKAGTEFSEATAAIIGRAMAKQREQRYADARELLEDIESALLDLGAPGAPDVGRAQGAGAVRRAARREAKTWAAVAVTAAALVALIATISLWPRPGPPGRRPRPAPPAVQPKEDWTRPDVPTTSKLKDEDLKLLARTRQWVKRHQTSYRSAIQKYNDAMGEMTDDVVKMWAQDDLYELDLRRSRAAEDTFKAVEKRAAAALAARDYDRAIAAYELPGELADMLSDRAAAAVRKVKGKADAAVERGLDKGRKLSEAGRPVDAIAELDKLAAMKYAGLPKAMMRALRERFIAEGRNIEEINRRRAVVRAKGALQRLLANIDAAVAKGDLARAEQLGNAALTSKTLDPIKAKARLVAKVGKLLPQISAKRRARAPAALERYKGKIVTLRTTAGIKKGRLKSVTSDEIVLERTVLREDKVELQEVRVPVLTLSEETLTRYKVQWTPTTADEAVAAAIFALAARDAEKMEAAVKLARGHGLYRRYQSKLVALKKAPLEAAAKASWKKDLAPIAAAKQLDEDQATTARRALGEFRRKHGSTDFARSLDKEMAALAARIAEAIAGEELARMRKLFKGKVLEFDPMTLRIKLLYDFESAEQGQDWMLTKWPLTRRRQLKIHNGALRPGSTARQVLMKARFTSVTASVDFAVGGGTYGATVLVCADGLGNHYELVGLWKTGDNVPPLWRCHLSKWVGGKFAAEEGKWPIRPSPFAKTKRGALSLSFDNGRLRGQVGKEVFAARDDTHKSGHVGVWACQARNASFDNFRVDGILERKWLTAELRKAGLGNRPGRPPPRHP